MVNLQTKQGSFEWVNLEYHHARRSINRESIFYYTPGNYYCYRCINNSYGRLSPRLKQNSCICTKTEKIEQHVRVDDTTGVDNDDRVVKDSSFRPGKISYAPGTIKHLTRYIVYTITEAGAETFPNGEVVLNVKLKCTNNSVYEYSFLFKKYRRRINYENYGPEHYSPSRNYVAVPARGFKKLEYNFKLPRGIKNFDLAFSDLNNEIGSSAYVLK